MQKAFHLRQARPAVSGGPVPKNLRVNSARILVKMNKLFQMPKAFSNTPGKHASAQWE
jgi:hypothetical protein